jgi:predicted RNA-binding Zn-ribbon protein involved in translation (DUF1610 family)
MNTGGDDILTDLPDNRTRRTPTLGFENTSVPTSSYNSARNFKCPVCGGEFNSWETRFYKLDGKGNKRESMTRSGIEKEHCPFCGLEKMEYDKEQQDGNTQ